MFSAHPAICRTSILPLWPSSENRWDYRRPDPRNNYARAYKGLNSTHGDQGLKATICTVHDVVVRDVARQQLRAAQLESRATGRRHFGCKDFGIFYRWEHLYVKNPVPEFRFGTHGPNMTNIRHSQKGEAFCGAVRLTVVPCRVVNYFLGLDHRVSTDRRARCLRNWFQYNRSS